ncbi:MULTISPECIES: hypothetical protein [unclassified Marinobacterium]|jgi:hypothetical protein|uniref:hypothetical protein n=1 Tax=unclassified Marinobacterium TaxID=2644139 RepID=UPI0015697288|nr:MULTISPECIES: hypothetical protein [unclassified Marinobacterium]NRP46351.1 hypothetical protein [Marinobacterium sp. xm-d-543]NRQ22687.1 hypothetical protein [Marinobacterium sp. xm-m-312]
MADIIVLREGITFIHTAPVVQLEMDLGTLSNTELLSVYRQQMESVEEARSVLDELLTDYKNELETLSIIRKQMESNLAKDA